MRRFRALEICIWAGIVGIRVLFKWDVITGRRYRSEKGSVFGSSHGGWRIPLHRLKSGMVVVSAGVGEETSFDEDLLQRVGARVLALDPTPRAVEFGSRLAETCSGFEFYPLGLWEEDGEQVFHAPGNPSHVSHSLVALQGEAPAFQALCVRWSTFLDQHDLQKVDLLKMDIEGAEHRVIADLVSSTVLPGILCLEFDEIQNPIDPHWRKRILKSVTLLEKHGYALYAVVHKSNYTFVLNDRFLTD